MRKPLDVIPRTDLSSPARASRYHRRVSKRFGLSTVEMAISLPFLFLLIFGIVDVGRVLFAHMTLQHAVREAGRFAVTGRSLPGQNGTTPRLDSIIQTVIDDSRPFVLTGAAITVSSAAGGSNNAGGPGDIITIRVTYPVVLLTPLIGTFFQNGQFSVRVSTTFKNEPFPPNLAP